MTEPINRAESYWNRFSRADTILTTEIQPRVRTIPFDLRARFDSVIERPIRDLLWRVFWFGGLL